MYTLLTESLPVNVLELQPSFLFKEWQISPIYSHKQPSRSILWNNCSKTFHKILRKASVVDSFSLLKLNIYIYIYIYPNELSLQKFLKFLRAFLFFWEHFPAIASMEQKTFKKQLSEGAPWNSCSEIFEEITRELSMIKCFGS